jgi:hypothetical protein
MVTLWPEIGLPFGQFHTHQGGHQAQARARQPTTEQQAARRRSHLTGKQPATAVQPHAPSRHEPTLEAERILMVEFTSAQAQAEEVAAPASHKGGHAEAAAAKPLSTSPLLTADGVHKMYRQLAEIHAVAAMQLLECAHWRRSESTFSSVWARFGRLRPIVMPSTIRLAPSPLLISSPRPCCGGRVSTVSLRLTAKSR